MLNKEIYTALFYFIIFWLFSEFYTKDGRTDHSEIISRLFAAEPPMPADSHEAFNTLLTDITGDANSLEIIKSIQDEIGILNS